MFMNFIGASGRFLKPLQFPDDGTQGGGTGTPPSSTSQVVTEPVTPVQAPITPTDTGNQGQTVEQQLQAALSGMGNAQRDRAAWVNVAKEYGFNSPEEAKAAFQGYQAYQELQSNPIPAILETLKSNPMQAAQIFAQVFNNQQPQVSPYENVTTYDEFGNALIPQAVQAVQKEYDPRLSRIENYINQQYETGIKARENVRINEFAQKYPSSGVTPDAVWNKAKEIGIPISTIDQQPWVIDGIMSQIMGGLGKSIETLAAPIGDQKLKTYQQQVISNAQTTAQVTPTGGIVATPGAVPFQEPDKIKAEMRRIWDIQNAAKT